MNLRRLAANDTVITIEGVDSGNAEFTLFNDNGAEWHLTGIVGDIGLMLDTEGNVIAGRTVQVVYRSNRVMSGETVIEPKRGWKVSYADLSGKVWHLFVSFCEPDRTLGLTRMYLVLDLKNE